MRQLISAQWVLLGPDGKQAGRRDQRKLAAQIAAIYITAKGYGGGIISALLPKTDAEWDQLEELLARGYSIKKVQPRQSPAKDVRDAVMSDHLMAQLAVRFERDKGKSPKAMHAVNREFSVWISDKLSDTNSNDVKKIVEAAHPELANRTKPDWWKKQLNQRINKKK